jgi:hypothetical protein
VKANDFWHDHYSLKLSSAFKEKHIGERMIDLILINTILPFQYLISLRNKNVPGQMKVMERFSGIRAEQNTMITTWKGLGVPILTAVDTQAMTHLKKNYCTQKRCLECAIGNAVLKE